jgi:hypothetical protein
MRAFLSFFIVLTFVCSGSLLADEKADAKRAALALATPLEAEGYAFRQEFWTGAVQPSMGRAVRAQLFKGLDYRVCVALPADARSKITAMVLDFEGKPVGRAKVASDGRSVVISFKPRKTGVYAIAIRQTEGQKEVTCALVTGWK